MNKLQKLILRHKRRKILNYFKKYKAGRFRKLIYISLATIFLVILYFSVSISRVSSARLDLFSMKQDYKSNEICHDNCLVYRNTLREELISNINTDEELTSDWRKYWNEAVETQSYAWQRELLSLASYSEDKEEISLYLVDYLIDESVDIEAKANIIKFYLSPLDGVTFIPYYFYLLEGDNSTLKKSAVNALSNLRSKELLVKDTYLESIKGLILNDTEDKSIKLDLVFLLSEIYHLNAELVADSLKEIYEKTTDEVMKYLIAELLTSNNYEGYELLEIPNFDWSDYLN